MVDSLVARGGMWFFVGFGGSKNFLRQSEGAKLFFFGSPDVLISANLVINATSLTISIIIAAGYLANFDVR